MLNYQRNGRGQPTQAPTVDPTSDEEQIRVDGFQQVLEMLRVADPVFRDSLLRRIAARDGKLARMLIRDLSKG